jgi:hypothetical protein
MAKRKILPRGRSLVPIALYDRINGIIAIMEGQTLSGLQAQLLAELQAINLHLRALVSALPEPLPSIWAYDRALFDEARERGIDVPYSSRAMCEPFRRDIDQKIGRDVVMKRLFPRKPGQRGPGKEHQTGVTETGAKKNAQRRKVYAEKKTNPYRAGVARPKAR